MSVGVERDTRSPRTPPLAGRRADIQGLRAVAVLMVVAFHAGLPVPGGFVGVDVFFVISGFVITAMLRRQWLSTGRIKFRAFYARRFRRLTPALSLTVTVSVILSALLLSPFGPQQNAAITAIGAMLLSANFVIAGTTGDYFDAPAESNPLLNTWSLSVEEQFYLVFPALLAFGWLLARRGRRVSRVFPLVVVGSVAVVSFVFAVLGSSAQFTFPGSSILLGFYSPLTRAWEFAAGAVLALVLSSRRTAGEVRRKPGGWWYSLGAAGAGALCCSLLLISEATTFPGFWTLIPVVGTLLLLAAGIVQESNPVTRVLASAPMVRIGDCSYSIYLWHWPLIVFAAAIWPDSPVAVLLAVAAAFVTAIGSYRWVERPIREMNSISTTRFAILVATTLAVPLALAVLLASAAGNGWWSSAVRDYQRAAIPNHIGIAEGCHTSKPVLDRSESACSWNVSGGGMPVYLVGDSNANHFSEAVIIATRDLDRPLWIGTVDSCPFLDAYVSGANAPNPFYGPCRDYYVGTMERLADQPPGLVIISTANDLYTDAETALGLAPNDLGVQTDFKIRALAVGLTGTVNALQGEGHRVLLVQAVPHFVDPYLYEPTACSVHEVQSGQCDRVMAREFTNSVQQSTRDAILRVAANTGVPVLDLQPVLCPHGTCSTRRGDLILYQDGGHISVPGSISLAPEFEEAIRPLAASTAPPSR